MRHRRLRGPAAWILAAATVVGCADGGRESAPRAGPVPWLQDYLRIDTTNPPGNEAAAVSFLAQILESRQIRPRTLTTPTGRASLVAEIGPAGTPALVLLHHSDVVPAGPGWTTDPFGGELRDGRIWGRGAIDSKGLGIAHLTAFLELATRRDELRRRVVFFVAADEEEGGLEGTGWWVDRRPDLFEGVRAVLTEGGYNRAAKGRVAWWGVETAQKRPVWLDLTAPNARTLVAALAALLDQPPRWRLVEPVRLHFEALRKRRLPGGFDAEEAMAAADPSKVLRHGHAVFFLDSLQVNVLDADGDGARATLDARLLPGSGTDAFVDSVRSVLGPDVRVEVRLSSPESRPTAADGEVWRLFEAALPGPVVPYFLSGITDARFFRQQGVAAYGFSPFALDGAATRTVHAPDERIQVDELLAGVERMKTVLRAWALPPSPTPGVR